MSNEKQTDNNSLYSLIPLDDLLKIRLHADFQHGVFSTKKTPAKAMETAASMPPKAGGV